MTPWFWVSVGLSPFALVGLWFILRAIQVMRAIKRGS
jgi:hypothetical protein